jgi:hypothetical protein
MHESELIVKSLDAEPVKNLLGPATKELGLLAGDLAELVRFYVNSNLDKVFCKWAQRRRGQEPLHPEQIAKVIPLLHAASLQTDDGLQERWAALLESTVTNTRGILPSYGQALAQLTADEANYLERLHSYAVGRQQGDGKYLGEVDALANVYNVLMASRPVMEINPARLLIQDLERLGLITRQHTTDPLPEPLGAPSAISATACDGIDLRTFYSISEYGLCFIQAVTHKSLDQYEG